MSHENSMQIDQQELAPEYGRYIESKSNKGAMRFFIKALIIPLVVMLIILTGAAFIVANFSPAMYTQAKDILFEKVDFEKIIGRADVINKDILDSWLILNSEKHQGEELIQEEQTQQEMAQEKQLENQPN
ncbi:hypothetical protein [Kaarinaea lacus]